MEAAELLGINDCGFAVEHLHEQLGKRLSMSPTLATLHTPSRAGADFVPGSCDSAAAGTLIAREEVRRGTGLRSRRRRALKGRR